MTEANHLTTALIILILIALVISIVALILTLSGLKRQDVILRETLRRQNEIREELRDDMDMTTQSTKNHVDSVFKNYGEAVSRSISENLAGMSERIRDFSDILSSSSRQNEQKLDNIRTSMRDQLRTLTRENNEQLEKMRETVDEKLQKTLEERIGQSFRRVNEELEKVYRGLGEMQTLATGVGDLKKVLSNVKTRGMLGEMQLGNILGEILSPEQYEVNVRTKRKSAENVEYAVKLPGQDDSEIRQIWLPIDSKFPGETYQRLIEASETGDPALIEEASRELRKRLKAEAKDIRDKYLDPPYTTNFGIMFLPFEGLYAEAVKLGMMEELQREYRVNIAGPTTMAALLNSLQMGFRTLAIQKHSSEVWKLLADVKKEFATFADVLDKARRNLNSADQELEKLIGVRTRQINRRLEKVEALDYNDEFGGNEISAD
ncbi:MAG: DNA recombination protein RmuC [Lachnospiraceae bacterium]|nr:DNA recombination protein RmuC [Lachnospiraceae bacterium]